MKRWRRQALVGGASPYKHRPPAPQRRRLMLARGLMHYLSGVRAGIAASLANDPLRGGAHETSLVYLGASCRLHVRIRVNRTVGLAAGECAFEVEALALTGT